jgi:hypothetical protein
MVRDVAKERWGIRRGKTRIDNLNMNFDNFDVQNNEKGRLAWMSDPNEANDFETSYGRTYASRDGFCLKRDERYYINTKT